MGKVRDCPDAPALLRAAHRSSFFVRIAGYGVRGHPPTGLCRLRLNQLSLAKAGKYRVLKCRHQCRSSETANTIQGAAPAKRARPTHVPGRQCRPLAPSCDRPPHPLPGSKQWTRRDHIKSPAGRFIAWKGLVDLRTGTDAVYLRIHDFDRYEADVVHCFPICWRPAELSCGGSQSHSIKEATKLRAACFRGRCPPRPVASAPCLSRRDDSRASR